MTPTLRFLVAAARREYDAAGRVRDDLWQAIDIELASIAERAAGDRFLLRFPLQSPS